MCLFSCLSVLLKYELRFATKDFTLTFWCSCANSFQISFKHHSAAIEHVRFKYHMKYFFSECCEEKKTYFTWQSQFLLINFKSFIAECCVVTANIQYINVYTYKLYIDTDLLYCSQKEFQIQTFFTLWLRISPEVAPHLIMIWRNKGAPVCLLEPRIKFSLVCS